jgi:pimeloyl-ACP methyl ester carboxylesterase
MESTKKLIRINDLDVVYYQHGHGKPLLFLHGGRVQARTFKRSLKYLAERYTVIAPDIPGYGGSTTPKDVWSFTEYAAFFDSFLKALKLSDVTLVGYSMGGGIAFNLAALSNDISRLILVDSSGLHAANATPNTHDLQRLWFYCTHPRYISTLTILLRDYVQFLWKHKSDYAHMQAIRHTTFNTPYDKVLRGISIPTLLLWGQNDRHILLACAYEFQKQIPQATLKTIVANHDWPLYKPLLFSQSVL